jgi:hypothetical protein
MVLLLVAAAVAARFQEGWLFQDSRQGSRYSEEVLTVAAPTTVKPALEVVVSA